MFKFRTFLVQPMPDAKPSRSALPPFNFNELAPKGAKARFVQRATEALLPALLWLLREFNPIAKFGGFYWITRKKDVIRALDDHDAFAVPYGPDMRLLSKGDDGEADFVLGVDGEAQRRQNAIIREIIPNEDLSIIGQWSRMFAESLTQGGGGRLDVVGDFAIRIPTEICRRYFGLNFSDPDDFAQWSIAVSAMLFANSENDEKKRALGLAGAARLRQIIDTAIRRAAAGAATPAQQEREATTLTLVERLVLASAKHELTHREIRAIVLGLVVGFIPTNGLAAAKIFELILNDRGRLEDAKRAAERASRNDSKEAAEGFADLQKLLLDAARWNPALAPGQWRRATRDVIVGRGESYERTIPAGAKVMVSTMSALRDSRDATSDPANAALIFGHGVHKCLGERLAMEIITQMSRVLFSQSNILPARDRYGVMQRIGYFPKRLDIEYDSREAKQSMIICCIPVETDISQTDLEQMLESLGNPARPDVASSLESAGIVHFASASVVSANNDGAGDLRLLLEFNVDGDKNDAIRTIVEHAQAWLAPIVRAVSAAEKPLAEIIAAHSQDPHFWPWGKTGLQFFGLPGLSVAKIAAQARLRAVAEEELSRFLKEGDHPGGGHQGLGDRAMIVLGAVRRALRANRGSPELDAFLVQPGRASYLPSGWRRPAGYWDPLAKVFLSSTGARILAIGLVSFGAFAWLAFHTLGGVSVDENIGLWTRAGQATIAIGVALGLTTLFWASIGAAAYFIFLWVEARESAEDLPPDPRNVQRIVSRENAVGYEQNHIISASRFKSGLIRRMSFAFAMWGIAQSLNWFRPGFVVTMGTIHFAKWFRLPGSDKMIFQSNYTGSWESYLEDFITRASPGQTAAWSNCENFPHSRALIGEGASDGDRFKRWVRRQQIPTAFWYSRFPKLTAAQIRINALVHEGLARARTDTTARSWLDLFGSMQRQPHELESAEIQTIVFRGLKRAANTACIPIRLSEDANARSVWLKALGRRLSFGKFVRDNTAIYLGVGPAGIRKFSGDAPDAEVSGSILGGFPIAFVEGMNKRAQILRDPHETLRWRDGDSAADSSAIVDCVLLVYAKDAAELERIVADELDALKSAGELVHSVIRTVRLDAQGQVNEDASTSSYEHFGFRDGVSNPAIRGVEQFTPGAREQDIVEPGEFVLGYRNNQGHFVPGVMVGAETDVEERLPVDAGSMPFSFAHFQGSDEQFMPRDLGRNGSFMVIRQFGQDAKGFKDFVENRASELKSEYGPERLASIVGQSVDGRWLAAKMVGRWQDGTPLVRNPSTADRLATVRYPSNDFSFGRDDPRGHACPLGAHIRRTNPRDSMEPGDPLEYSITRRHLLLRRGRPYFYDPATKNYPVKKPSKECETGLLFIALCADLERQFEMVQQTWLSSPSFHGLSDEPDPIAANDKQTQPRNFTIPTSAGPLLVRGMQSFVDLKGGGYFFVPSRSAIDYLATLSCKDQDRPILFSSSITPT